MRRLATLAVVAALISPTVASGQDYSFGDWARDQGYSPGDVMPERVNAAVDEIDSLDGIDEFDWTTTPTASLNLGWNQISSIEANDFSGLTNLRRLYLGGNQISSIESGDFSELTNLGRLTLNNNQISSIEPGDFSGLTKVWELTLSNNQISTIESGAFGGLTNLGRMALNNNQISSIEPGDFDGQTSLTWLILSDNQISSIESGDFSGLTNLGQLWLSNNQISSIEPGAFGGLTKLRKLLLDGNAALTELNLPEADFSSLLYFDVTDNANITSVSLRNTVVNQTSLTSLVTGGRCGLFCVEPTGIGDLNGITEMDFSGIDFADITDLAPLYVMDDLTDLWLVDTKNVDATDLDVLLDNLETIEGTDTEGILYMTEADFDAFNTAGGGLLADWDAEPGHHVEFLQIGDVNHDTEFNGRDVDPFVDVLLASRFDVAADMNGDGAVNGLDVEPFVAAVVGGTRPSPEPSTLLLAIVALGIVVGVCRRGP